MLALSRICAPIPAIDFGIFLNPCSLYAAGERSEPAFFAAVQSGLRISAAHHVVFFTTPFTRLCPVASMDERGLSLLGDLVANQLFAVENIDAPLLAPCEDPCDDIEL